MIQPQPTLEQQSANAVALVRQRLDEINNGTIRLNHTSDEKDWDRFGIKAYALTDNPVVARFTRDSEEDAV